MIDRVNVLLADVAREAGDWRTCVVDVQPAFEQDRLVLQGAVLEPQLYDRLVDRLRVELPEVELVDRLDVLVGGPDYGWAMVARPLLNLRREPSHGAELLSQALFGEAVEILRRVEGWCFVRVRDGYLGWVQSLGLQPGSQPTALAYRQAATHIVSRPFAPCYNDAGQQVALLPFGVALAVEQVVAGTAYIRTPAGETWRAASDTLLDAAERPGTTSAGLTQLFDILECFVGTPYLWGGSSPFGFDCSGLAQAAYGFLGIALPRDADMQAQCGRPVDLADIRRGDLLFFTSREFEISDTIRRGRVTHVALAVDSERILHANQRYWGVTINSLRPGQPDSFAELRDLIVAVRRHAEE